MAHTHQAKRPYNGPQPSITSYFSTKTTSSSPSTTTKHSHNEQHRSPSPALPQTVQANLLSVGMRVRKSVPEGYKTGTQYSAFGLFSASNAPASQPQAAPAAAPKKKKAGGRPRARELTPFCGILNVGGLSMQQWGIYDSSAMQTSYYEDEEDEEEEDEDDDDMPVLSSQGSTISTSSVGTINGFGGPAAGNANKRRFFDEDDDGGIMEVAMPWAGGNGAFGGERVMAVPRRKRPGSMTVRRCGQENGNGEMDFEDAEFLDYGLAVGGEVEMGGV